MERVGKSGGRGSSVCAGGVLGPSAAVTSPHSDARNSSLIHVTDRTQTTKITYEVENANAQALVLAKEVDGSEIHERPRHSCTLSGFRADAS